MGNAKKNPPHPPSNSGIAYITYLIMLHDILACTNEIKLVLFPSTAKQQYNTAMYCWTPTILQCIVEHLLDATDAEWI